MQEAVLLAALRTPVGKHRGILATVRPDDLLGDLFATVCKRANVDPGQLGEVFAGCANQAGEDNRNVARMACLIAGFPYEVPAVTVNRLCASGLDAVVQGVRSIWVGDQDLVLAGGVESMSRAPLVVTKGDQAFGSGNRTMYDTSLGWRFPNPRLEARFPLEGMGETAENLVTRFGVSRADQDAFALESHRRAIAAWEAGRFAAEVVPVRVGAPGKETFVGRDEQPRADTTLEKLASLKPAFRKGGTVTAGNSSSLNDGAAAVLLASAAKAKELGLAPLARVVACGSAGVDPQTMGIGPVPATRKALGRAGWQVADLELVELNEAFAVQALAVMRELGLDPDRVNVNGGAIAIGHPLGASGARILTTLVHELRRRGSSRGLATLCVGVGQGSSVLVEALG